MKRDFSEVMKDADGSPHVKPIFSHDAAGLPEMETLPSGQRVQKFLRHEPMTFRQYVLDALAGRWQGEDKLSWDQIKKRMELHDRICFDVNGAREVDVDASQIQIIKDCLEAQKVTPYVIYRIGSMLDRDPKPI